MTDPRAAHPDADTLCDLDAGVLAGTPVEADLDDHVAGCPSCADFMAVLAGTRARLAGMPAEPMPSAVADRIDAALAAQAAGGAAAVTPLNGRRPHKRGWLPGAGAVAAGVALLMVGLIGVSALRSQGGHSTPTAGLAKRGSHPTNGVGQAAGGLPNYTARTLAGGVRELLGNETADSSAAQGRSAASAQPLAAPRATDGPLTPLRRPTELAACVAELAGRPGVAPLAVQYAAFQGQPVAIIVLPDPDPAIVEAWVVGPACTTGRADLRRYELVPRAG